MHKIYTKIVLLSALIFSSLAFGQACTFNEAKLALENGHFVRGNALLHMAARDGDLRAVRLLAKSQVAKVKVSDIRGQKIDSLKLK